MNSAICNTLEPAIDPNNRISFLLDWELTLKCNLDCSYCGPGHDNSTCHPPLLDCLNSIDFMFKYVDLYMATKPKGIRYVILNVYGGESLYHPDIITILKQVHQRYQTYRDRWQLTVTTTTNDIVSTKQLKKIIPLIDEFTVSYHTENTPKQKQQFCDNLLRIQQANRRLKCIVLVHPEPENFQDVNQMIDWLKENNIRHLPRQLDHGTRDIQFNYRSQQVKWFKKLYQEKSHNVEVKFKEVIDNDGRADLAETGRACCGGRQLCSDQNYKQRNFFVNNTFTDWYCSVDKFFLYIKQVDKIGRAHV